MTLKRNGLKIAAGAIAVMTLLAGCGGSNGAKKASDGKPIVAVQVVKDARTKKMADLPWTKDLETRCDCHIQWQDVAASSWDQQKKAALAAGEVADITIGGFGSGDMGEYGSLFLDLKPEIKHMKNLQKLFKAEPYAQAISTTADGKILGSPTVGRTITARTSNHMFINKQWLDKLGLKVPTTWDELEKVLIAFKNQDPNGNGRHDEIPLDFNSPGTGGFGLFQPNVLLSSFGITVPNGPLGMYVKDGKVQNYLTDPHYKELIQFLHKLWADGVISSEAFTHDWSKYTSTSKGEGNVAKVGMTWMWTPSDIFGSTLGPQYVTMPALKAHASDTNKLVWSYNGDDLAYQVDRAVVSKKAANKDAALKIVDAFYAPDMSVQMRYGAFGTCVKKNGPNDYTVLKPQDKTKNASDWQFTNALADGAPAWIGDNMKLNLPPEHTEYRATDAVYDGNFKNVDFNKDVLYANMPMTTEQTRKMNENNTGITQSAMSKFAQWVTKGGVDKEWDSYVAGLKKNNLDENIKIEQQVYDHFKSNMDKIGVNLNSTKE